MLEKIPYSTLIIFAIFLGLAPFRPMPHLVEKLIMLYKGTLNRPIDIFDLLFHTSPFILIIIKFVMERYQG